MNRLLLLMLLIYNVSANDPCNVYSNKVRRINIILPIDRIVRALVLHPNYVLISLDRSVVGNAGYSHNRIGRFQQRLRKSISTIFMIEYIFLQINHKKDNRKFLNEIILVIIIFRCTFQ